MPTDVSIIFRVFNLGSSAEVQLLIDPWNLYLNRFLELRIDDLYHGKVVVEEEEVSEDE
jgi:hypothetical protein